jgi:BlaI family transcriptional regulator, penicillinase repressor
MHTAGLSRRERQIMDVLFRQERASASEVLDALPDPPSYSAVRAQLRILEEKGHVTHIEEGPRYIYTPTVAPEKARRSALRHMLNTFFDDSPAQAVAALLDDAELTADEYDRLAHLIDQARSQGR